MDHHDHVRLLSKGVRQRGGVWADLGAGSGAFTLALADLIGAHAMIYAVDRDRQALDRLAGAMARSYPGVRLETVVADFARPLNLPPLDGIVMANSLHFVREPLQALRRVVEMLKPGASFILVEYNTDNGNTWTPWPLSWPTWRRLAAQCGLEDTELLATQPSRFLREIYAAGSLRAGPRSSADLDEPQERFTGGSQNEQTAGRT